MARYKQNEQLFRVGFSTIHELQLYMNDAYGMSKPFDTLQPGNFYLYITISCFIVKKQNTKTRQLNKIR